MAFPPCPDSLKAVAHYLKVAEEHDSRDIVVAYWCRLHALEISIKIATVKTPEINKLLLALMDWLEKTKTEHATNEGITSKVCAQATVENYALKLFKYADEQDRAENYGKNVVKAFYTAGILMDVLTAFGDLTEDITEKRKYAKWKAAYIHNCLKAGEKPVPGPLESNEDNDEDFVPVPKSSGNTTPNINSFPDPPAGGTSNGPPAWNMGMFPSTPQPPSDPSPSTFIPPDPFVPQTPTSFVPQTPTSFVPSDPQTSFVPAPAPATVYPSSSTSTVNLDAEQISKAQKYCKWASSALNYDDIKSAVDNLQKALHLLTKGKESPE